MHKVYGVCGRKNHGKDSFAQYIKELDPEYVIIHFADKLKADCKNIFGLTDDQVFNPLVKEVPLFEKPEEHINMDAFVEQMKVNTGLDIQPCGKEARTPREIMQFYGTDYVRKTKDSYWVDIVRDQIKARPFKVLIPDTRFPNEEIMLHEVGAEIIKLIRLNYSTNEFSGHASETEVDKIRPDIEYFIDTLDTLKKYAKEIVSAGSGTSTDPGAGKAGADPSKEDIKKAWKKKCNEHHPDKGGDKDKFLEVTHAYKMLTDPSYRYKAAEEKRGRKGDLDLRMKVPIDFEAGFFGKRVIISYNQIELGDDDKPMVKEHYESIVLTVDIPAGSFPGHEAIFEGKGLKKGETLGVCYATFIPQPHPKFRVEGPDVSATERMPLDLMIKGGEIEVLTLFGLKTLYVPPGTQPGARLIISKAGVMNHGNHIVVVEPVFPNKEDLKNKDAWKKLDINWAQDEEKQRDEEAERLEKLFASYSGGFIVFTR